MEDPPDWFIEILKERTTESCKKRAEEEKSRAEEKAQLETVCKGLQSKIASMKSDINERVQDSARKELQSRIESKIAELRGLEKEVTINAEIISNAEASLKEMQDWVASSQKLVGLRSPVGDLKR